MGKRSLVAWLTLIGYTTLVLGASCGLKSHREQSPVASQKPSRTLIIFAAASLKESFDQIAQAFSSIESGAKVAMNYAGSQQLAQQIQQGAQADVFASANQDQMDELVAAGLVQPGNQVTFAQNRLVVIFPADNPAGIVRLQDLEKPGLHLILAAPEVPVGQYTLQFLEKASQTATFPSDFKEKVLDNVMSYEENVKAVLSKVSLGEADAGIVYVSDVTDPKQVGRLEIPDALNVKASYLIAPLQTSSQPKLAADFIAFVLSEPGQSILADHSFIPVR